MAIKNATGAMFDTVAAVGIFFGAGHGVSYDLSVPSW